jgi:UDPglucose 6-dehydrogenase
VKLGIVGGGVVGRATARAFIEHVDEVRVYDVLAERRTHSLDEVLQSGIIFICLPTPRKEGSLGCDTSALDNFFHAVRAVTGHNPPLVIRSTVPVGYTRAAAARWCIPTLIHSPEFLTGRCAVTDAQLPARNVIGVPEPRNDAEHPLVFSGTNRAAQTLNVLYHTRFPGVPVHLMSSDESEAVKLFQNGFFASKIAYWNECRALADVLGLDWGRVLAGVLADGRISHSHTRVPGPDGRFGFADGPGDCLGKDLASLVSQFIDAGLGPHVTHAAHLRNKADRERGVP